jgi:hypothetical protein
VGAEVGPPAPAPAVLESARSDARGAPVVVPGALAALGRGRHAGLDYPDVDRARAGPRRARVMEIVTWSFVVWMYLQPVTYTHEPPRRALDRIVMPTRAACEAARQGVEEYARAEDWKRFEAGPCEPSE